MDGATQALRSRSPEQLEAELLRTLIEGQTEFLKDDRDFMLELAPFHDCARRLGVDVRQMFDRVARRGPPRLAATVEAFGARRDIRPQNFGYEVERTPEGPRYKSTLSGVDVAELENWMREET